MSPDQNTTTEPRVKKKRCLAIALLLAVIALLIWQWIRLENPAITKGPMILRVAQDRVALMWETNEQGIGEVWYGLADNAEQTLDQKVLSESEQFSYGWPLINRQTVFIHKVWLENLAAGTAYRYRVHVAQIKSEPYEFRTTPADANQVRFVVYGDSRTYPDQHRRIVEQIIKTDPDFVVNSGDLVTRGHEYDMWGPQFFAPLKGLAESVCIYTVKGNHEKGHDGIFNYERLLVPPDASTSFTFEYGPLRYVCLDQWWQEQRTTHDETTLLDWLFNAAHHSEKTWNMVSYHIPSLNMGGHFSSWGHPYALPALAAANVDFVITGHSHQYERFRPVAPPVGTDGAYVTCITSGGGGANLYDVKPHDFHAAVDSVHHFCLFEINGERLTIDTIDIDGEVIDHLEISKSDGRLNNDYLQTALPMGLVRLHQDLRTSSLALASGPRIVGEPFTVKCHLLAPHTPTIVNASLSLQAEPGMYELGIEQQVLIPPTGGQVDISFAVTPLVEIELKKQRETGRSFKPALSINCRYESPYGQGDVSIPVLWKN